MKNDQFELAILVILVFFDSRYSPSGRPLGLPTEAYQGQLHYFRLVTDLFVIAFPQLASLDCTVGSTLPDNAKVWCILTCVPVEFKILNSFTMAEFRLRLFSESVIPSTVD